MAGWITINGTHIYVKDGEDVSEAFERTTGQKLEGKGNPEQGSNAKKFTINDALRKVSDERGKEYVDKVREAMRRGDKLEAVKNEAVVKEMAKDEIEAGKLTAKGAEASKAAEEKKAKKEYRKERAAEILEDTNSRRFKEIMHEYEQGKWSPSGRTPYKDFDDFIEKNRDTGLLNNYGEFGKNNEEYIARAKELFESTNSSNQNANDNIRAAVGRTNSNLVNSRSESEHINAMEKYINDNPPKYERMYGHNTVNGNEISKAKEGYLKSIGFKGDEYDFQDKTGVNLTHVFLKAFDKIK